MLQGLYLFILQHLLKIQRLPYQKTLRKPFRIIVTSPEFNFLFINQYFLTSMSFLNIRFVILLTILYFLVFDLFINLICYLILLIIIFFHPGQKYSLCRLT